MSRLIVVIDDDPAVIELVEGVLRHEYNIQSFLDPQQALHAFEGGLRPDLILCDIMMPELSGFEMHAMVRALPEMVGVPFIYLTALDDRKYFRKGMNIGADDYLTKPFMPQELRDTVTTRLKRLKDISDSGPPLIRIQSMGGFQVSLSEERVEWSVKKAAVAFLLLLQQQRPLSLDEVKRELWWEPVVDNTLHVLHLRLRKVIDEFAELKVSQGHVRLTLKYDYDWDADNFEQPAQEALRHKNFPKLENAISQYGGDFLPGFDLPWTEHRRQHYEALYLKLLEASAACAPNETSQHMAQERLERFLGTT